MPIRQVISEGTNKLKSTNLGKFHIMSDNFVISMLWFQNWGENIPSFTEFRRLYKKKTARVVIKSSYHGYRELF